MPRIPKHVRDNFGGARAFRARARALARRLNTTLDDLRLGCAYFPEYGLGDMIVITKRIKALRQKLSVKHWGR